MYDEITISDFRSNRLVRGLQDRRWDVKDGVFGCFSVVASLRIITMFTSFLHHVYESAPISHAIGPQYNPKSLP
jgi:hypothetical protein